MKKHVLKTVKVLIMTFTILISNVHFCQQKEKITVNGTPIAKKIQTISLEEQIKTLGAEKINSLIKNRKATVESVFDKIKTYKTTSDTKVKTDLLLDLCTFSNFELNILLSKFGEKNDENAKLDVAFANYFKRADALVGQNVFIAGLDKSKSEKLNALNKTILKGDYKRPELIIFGIAEVICIGAPCCKCGGSGCNPCFSSGIDAPENLSKPKCPKGYTFTPFGCAPNEILPKEMPKDIPTKIISVETGNTNQNDNSENISGVAFMDLRACHQNPKCHCMLCPTCNDCQPTKPPTKGNK